MKETSTTVFSKISFSANSYHVKTSKLMAWQINWPISIWYEFLLKGVSRQTLITATLINFKTILVLYNLNSTNQGFWGFYIMEYKYIASKFTLQTQTNGKSTKIQTCLHGLFPWDISFQSSVKKHIPPVSQLCLEK